MMSTHPLKLLSSIIQKILYESSGFGRCVPTDSKREKGGRLEAADGSWFTPFLCRGKFFTSAQLLNWGIAPEELDACFVGREADRICSIFEKRKISDAIFRAGFSLEVDVFEELFPAWHDRDDSNWIDDERPVTPLSRDDIAVATWLRLTSNSEESLRWARLQES